MALIKCRECGTDVSTEADFCPHCGCRVKEKRSLKTWQKAALVVIPLIIAVVVIVYSKSTAWQRVFTVEYVGYELNYGNSYSEYKITNTTQKTVRRVYVIISVDTAYSGNIKFTDYVDAELKPGEEVDYRLYQETIKRECEAQGVDTTRLFWYNTVDIVGFEWE